MATIHKVKLSLNKGAAFCTTSLEGAKGEIVNVLEGFVEESPPNLGMNFEGVPVTTTCAGVKTVGPFVAHFFLDTMSTTTDTAFVG
jgi:hypothetical protein